MPWPQWPPGDLQVTSRWPPDDLRTEEGCVGPLCYCWFVHALVWLGPVHAGNWHWPHWKNEQKKDEALKPTLGTELPQCFLAYAILDSFSLGGWTSTKATRTHMILHNFIWCHFVSQEVAEDQSVCGGGIHNEWKCHFQSKKKECRAPVGQSVLTRHWVYQ